MRTSPPAKSAWQRWSERFEPPVDGSPLAVLRARAGAAVALGTFPIALLLAAAPSLLPEVQLVPLARALPLGYLAFALPWVAIAWSWRSLALLLHGLAAYVFVAACALTHELGGLRVTTSLLWVVPIPAALLTLLGPRHARPWLAAALVACGCFYALELMSYEFGYAASDGERRGIWISCLLGVTLLTLLLVAAYERAKAAGLRALDGARRALHKAGDAAAQQQQLRCELLARIARSLRAPLEGVLSAAETLADAETDATAATPVAAVRRNARRLIASLDDLRDLAELQAGSLKLRTARISPRAWSEELFAAMAPKAESQQVRFVLEVGEGVPEGIETDPTRLKRLLVALLSAALSRSSGRSVSLRVATARGGVSFEIVEPASAGVVARQENDLAEARLARQMTLEAGLIRGLAALLGARIETEARPDASITALRVPQWQSELAGSKPPFGSRIERAAASGAAKSLSVSRRGPLRALTACALERWRSALVPRELATDVYAVRWSRIVAHVALGGLLFMAVAWAAIPHAFAPAVQPALRALAIASMVLWIGAPWLLRATGSRAFATHVLLTAGALGIAGATWYSGGAGSVLASWNALIPMLAVALVGLRASLGWAAITSLEAGAFLWWGAGLEAIDDQLRPDRIALVACASLMLLTVLVHGVLALHDRGTRVMFDEVARMQAALESAHRLAQESASAVQQEALQIGHELRTPLTSILGFADVLLEDAPAEPAVSENRRLLRAIRRHGRRMLAVLDDWTTLTRLEVVQRDSSQRFSPAELLLKLLERAEAHAEPGTLEVEAVLEHPVPEWATGDAGRIEALLTSFIEHVVASAGEGRLRFSAGISSKSDPLWLGLRAERVAGSESPASARTSAAPEQPRPDLHLALCRRLGEQLGARLVLQDLERGSTVSSAAVPVAACHDDPLAHFATHATPGSAVDPRATRLELRILVAEDGADNRRLIRHLLERLGAEAVFVENGELALRRALFAEAELRPFDAVLMDLQMPEVDGYEATRTLRDAGFTRPIIALTAHASEAERERCLAAGFDGFAVKPIDRASLIAALLEARARSKPDRLSPRTA